MTVSFAPWQTSKHIHNISTVDEQIIWQSRRRQQAALCHIGDKQPDVSNGEGIKCVWVLMCTCGVCDEGVGVGRGGRVGRVMILLWIYESLWYKKKDSPSAIFIRLPPDIYDMLWVNSCIAMFGTQCFFGGGDSWGFYVMVLALFRAKLRGSI